MREHPSSFQDEARHLVGGEGGRTEGDEAHGRVRCSGADILDQRGKHAVGGPVELIERVPKWCHQVKQKCPICRQP